MGEDRTRDKTGSQVVDNGEMVMPERMIQSNSRSRSFIFVLGTLALAFGVPDVIESAERQRIPWTESKLVGSPDPPLPYRAVRAYEKLPLFAPVYLRPEPGTDQIFFLDHKGDWKEPGGLRYFTDKAEADSSKTLSNTKKPQTSGFLMDDLNLLNDPQFFTHRCKGFNGLI